MRQIINIAKTFFIFSFVVFLVIDICYGQNVVEVLRVREGIKISSITTPINVNASTMTVNNFPSKYNVSGSTISISNFPSVQAVSQYGNWNIVKATVVVENQITNISISTGTIGIRDDGGSRIIIRNQSPDRNLSVNTYNGIDVRLMNNTGTLISDTNALPVNYSIFISSYIDTESSSTIKSGSTYLARVIIGTAGSSSNITIRNGTSGTAPIVSIIDTNTRGVIDIGTILGAGLYIENTGTTPAKITLIYR